MRLVMVWVAIGGYQIGLPAAILTSCMSWKGSPSARSRSFVIPIDSWRASSCARLLGWASRREGGLDVGELPRERLVLGFEQFIGHVGRLEHREAERGAAVGKRNGS